MNEQQIMAEILEVLFTGHVDNLQHLAFEMGIDNQYPSDHDEVCHGSKLAERLSKIITTGNNLSDTASNAKYTKLVELVKVNALVDTATCSMINKEVS